MTALLGERAVGVEDENDVAIFERRQPVRNADERALLVRVGTAQLLDDVRFCHAVKRARGLVGEHDVGVLVDDVDRDVLGDDICADRWGHHELDAVASVQAM